MDTVMWELINTFAPWFSAIGTISAVVVSLYLKSQLNLKSVLASEW